MVAKGLLQVKHAQTDAETDPPSQSTRATRKRPQADPASHEEDIAQASSSGTRKGHKVHAYKKRLMAEIENNEGAETERVRLCVEPKAFP